MTTVIQPTWGPLKTRSCTPRGLSGSERRRDPVGDSAECCDPVLSLGSQTGRIRLHPRPPSPVPRGEGSRDGGWRDAVHVSGVVWDGPRVVRPHPPVPGGTAPASTWHWCQPPPDWRPGPETVSGTLGHPRTGDVTQKVLLVLKHSDPPLRHPPASVPVGLQPLVPVALVLSVREE